MKKTFVLFITSSILFIAGCGAGSQNEFGEEVGQNNRDMTYQQVRYNANNVNDEVGVDNDFIENEDRSITNQRDYVYNSAERRQHNDRYHFSERASNKITHMNQVERAYVATMGNQAYVAVRLEDYSQERMNNQLKMKIANQLKDMGVGIERVHVSESPELLETMRDYATYTGDFENDAQFRDELGDIIQRIFPND